MSDESKTIEALLTARLGLAPQPAWGPAISRFVARLASELGATPAEVVALAQRDERRLMQIAEACTVNESFFFRHPEHFARLAREVGAWHERNPSDSVVIWSAGCAHGEEPYSVAIALAENGVGAEHVSIRATDASADAITAARAGVFRAWSCRGMPEHLLNRYFRRRGPDQLEIADAVRAQVMFRHGSLTDDARALPSMSVHIILFRNVAIYLTAPALSELYSELARVLRPDGVLFVAPTDPVPPSTRFAGPDNDGGAYAPTPPGAHRTSLVPPPVETTIPTQPTEAPISREGRARGAAHLSRGDYQAAVEELRLAVCMDPADALARFWYAMALARSQGRQRALSQLQALIDDLRRDSEDRRLAEDGTTVGELLRAACAYKEQLQ